MAQALGLGIFVATLAAILARPWRLSEAHAALLGALMMLLTGLVRPAEAARSIAGEWNTYLFFLGLMATSALADRAGVFALLAQSAARWSKGSPRRLYFAVFALGALVTAVLSNDATALLLTPVVATLVLRLELPPRPFLFATTFIADTASFLLPVSNPINVLLLGSRVDLVTFLRYLFVPSLAAIVVNYLVFAWWFRHELGGRFRPERLQAVVADDSRRTRRMLWALGILAAGYVAAAWTRLPLGPVALGGAVFLAVVARTAGAFEWRSLWRGISWTLFGFLTGMIVLVRGLENLGVTAWFGEALLRLGGDSQLRAIVVTAFGTALGANLINNVPMALVMRAVLAAAESTGWALEPLFFAAVLGADLGPNVTTVGSLATILWVVSLRRYGITVSVRQYLFLGLLVVPAMLLLGSLAVWLQAGTP
ncbi:MAG: SLC13 family permease [Thermomicrobium sp.]|nr:SLC13 family permease [Thermomicrobium sp.]